MGADLYISKIEKTNDYGWMEVSKEAVESGYFRDCYNSHGLFAVMSATLNQELSWWETARQKKLFQEDSDNRLIMTVKGVTLWKQQLTPLLQDFKSRSTLYRREYLGDKKYKTTKIKKDKIQKYHDWADLLLRFIDIAIENQSEIRWSV